jgi:hypothetical protein
VLRIKDYKELEDGKSRNLKVGLDCSFAPSRFYERSHLRGRRRARQGDHNASVIRWDTRTESRRAML